MNKKLKKVGLVTLLVVVAGGVAVLVAHDQMTRHQRDLFSPRVFRRLAALVAHGTRPRLREHREPAQGLHGLGAAQAACATGHAPSRRAWSASSRASRPA